MGSDSSPGVVDKAKEAAKITRDTVKYLVTGEPTPELVHSQAKKDAGKAKKHVSKAVDNTKEAAKRGKDAVLEEGYSAGLRAREAGKVVKEKAQEAGRNIKETIKQ